MAINTATGAFRSAPFVVDQPSAIVSATDIATLAALVSDRYVITGELGHGGMATVYRAQDTRHGRPVALKVLRPELYSPGLAERFLSEIQVTAGLQHPHILPLFDSGSAGTLLYYVMPFVEGQTLRDRLTATPQLPVAEALRIGSEIAGALDYAHRHGVIHRDVKPENILFQDGAALVADFGIAFSVSRTSGERLTQTGYSIGTPTYMSPEQAVGERDLDARTDVYALGAVVYEMLAGLAPHTGDSAQAVLAKVLTMEPISIASLRQDVPAALAAVVMKALAREPADRWPTAAAFAAAMLAPPAEPTPLSGVVTAPRARSRGMAKLVAAGVGLLASGTAAWRLWPTTDPAPVVTSKRQVTFVGNVENSAISPDGKLLAYAARGDDSLSVFVQTIAGGNAIKLATWPNADVKSLRWSPDGTRLLATGVAGTTPFAYVIPALGGDVRTIPVASLIQDIGVLAAWRPDGETVSLWGRTNAGRARVIDFNTRTSDTASFAMPAFPFVGQGSWSARSQRLAWSAGERQIWLLSPTTKAIELRASDSQLLNDPQWDANDHALFFMGGRDSLLRLPLRARDARPLGEPVVVASGLEAWGNAEESAFSLSGDARRIVYTRVVSHSDITRVSTDSAKPTLPASTAMKWYASVSPDGRSMAYAERQGAGSDVWLVDLSNGARRQLTFDAALEAGPRSRCLVWSPDGSQLATVVNSRRKGNVAPVGIITLNGSSPLKVFESTGTSCVWDVSWGSARQIAFVQPPGNQIRILDPVSGSIDVVVADSAAELAAPVLSRDGRALAYYAMSSDSARSGLWARASPRDDYRRLRNAFVYPLLWTPGNSSVVARVGTSRDILEFFMDGRSRVVARAPTIGADCTPIGATISDGFMCTTPVSVADAWLLELARPK